MEDVAEVRVKIQDRDPIQDRSRGGLWGALSRTASVRRRCGEIAMVTRNAVLEAALAITASFPLNTAALFPYPGELERGAPWLQVWIAVLALS